MDSEFNQWKRTFRSSLTESLKILNLFCFQFSDFLHFRQSTNLRCVPFKYSWTPLIRIPRYFELKTVSFGFALHSFTISYFKLPLLRTTFRFPWADFEIAGFNCTLIVIYLCLWRITDNTPLTLFNDQSGGDIPTGDYVFNSKQTHRWNQPLVPLIQKAPRSHIWRAASTLVCC